MDFGTTVNLILRSQGYVCVVGILYLSRSVRFNPFLVGDFILSLVLVGSVVESLIIVSTVYGRKESLTSSSDGVRFL